MYSFFVGKKHAKYNNKFKYIVDCDKTKSLIIINNKTVQIILTSKLIEFDTVKIGVVEELQTARNSIEFRFRIFLSIAGIRLLVECGL